MPIKNRVKKQPDVINETDWRGYKCRFELFISDDFSNLENVIQSYGIILDEIGRILIVSGEGKVWILPGGGVEKGESYEDTIIREVYEEAAVVISRETIKPLFYQRTYIMKDSKFKYVGNQVRFTARIKRKDKFVADPDSGDISFQKFVRLESLNRYLKWGKTTKFIQENVKKLINAY